MNAEYFREYFRRYRAAHPALDKRVREKRKYNRTPAEIRHRAMRRHAAKLRRMPSWADRKQIRAVYGACPDGYHVDHIVPLRGRRVSGLHVACNLQYLPAIENFRKGNRFQE